MKCPKCSVFQADSNPQCSGCGVVFEDLKRARQVHSSRSTKQIAPKHKQQAQKAWESFSTVQRLITVVVFIVCGVWGRNIGYNFADSLITAHEGKSSSAASASRQISDATNEQDATPKSLYSQCLEHRKRDGVAETAAQESCKMYYGY